MTIRNALKGMDGSARVRAQESTPKSEAWVDAEHVRAISYCYWIVWLRAQEFDNREPGAASCGDSAKRG
jgi:hypothetical protein